MSSLPARLTGLVERQPVLAPVAVQLDAAFRLLVRTFAGGGTVYVGGNGGSAAGADHIVGELMKGMEQRRPVPAGTRSALAAAAPPGFAEDAAYLADRLELALPAVSLTSQTGLLTAVANDTAADMAIAQQVNGYGRPGDTFWALSTSGRSRNMVLGAIAARAAGVGVLALTGDPGEPLGGLADVWVKVPARDVAGVQELHLAVYHALCAALEEEFFG
jgi:D-sedoheptulose 7-phosphate isomerase